MEKQDPLCYNFLWVLYWRDDDIGGGLCEFLLTEKCEWTGSRPHGKDHHPTVLHIRLGAKLYILYSNAHIKLYSEGGCCHLA